MNDIWLAPFLVSGKGNNYNKSRSMLTLQEAKTAPHPWFCSNTAHLTCILYSINLQKPPQKAMTIWSVVHVTKRIPKWLIQKIKQTLLYRSRKSKKPWWMRTDIVNVIRSGLASKQDLDLDQHNH